MLLSFLGSRSQTASQGGLYLLLSLPQTRSNPFLLGLLLITLLTTILALAVSLLTVVLSSLGLRSLRLLLAVSPTLLAPRHDLALLVSCHLALLLLPPPAAIFIFLLLLISPSRGRLGLP